MFLSQKFDLDLRLVRSRGWQAVEGDKQRVWASVYQDESRQDDCPPAMLVSEDVD